MQDSPKFLPEDASYLSYHGIRCCISGSITTISKYCQESLKNFSKIFCEISELYNLPAIPETNLHSPLSDRTHSPSKSLFTTLSYCNRCGKTGQPRQHQRAARMEFPAAICRMLAGSPAAARLSFRYSCTQLPA